MLVLRNKGQCPKAKAVFFPAGANPEAESETQPGTGKKHLEKKTRQPKMPSKF